MVTIVLIHVLCHLYKLVDSLDLPIDGTHEIVVRGWRRHELKDLENLALQPRRRSHIIVIVLSILRHL